MDVMLDGMKMLESRGVGTAAAVKTINDFAYIQHFKEFGTDMYTKVAPAKDWLVWVQSEIAAEQTKAAEQAKTSSGQ